jgi:heptosyltransferase-2
VLVAGAAEDREVAEPIAAAIGSGAHAIAGETTLAEQLALCSLAHVTVTNDSGLGHLAGACGAATVVIFGSTSSAWTAPLGSRISVVQRAPVCAPCFQRTCQIGYRCLDAVTVAAVERACETVAA